MVILNLQAFDEIKIFEGKLLQLLEVEKSTSLVAF